MKRVCYFWSVATSVCLMVASLESEIIFVDLENFGKCVRAFKHVFFFVFFNEAGV